MLVVLFVAGLLGGALAEWAKPRSAQAQRSDLQVVEANEFRLVGRDGRVLARLAPLWPSAPDGACLTMYGPTGSAHVELGLSRRYYDWRLSLTGHDEPDQTTKDASGDPRWLPSPNRVLAVASQEAGMIVSWEEPGGALRLGEQPRPGVEKRWAIPKGFQEPQEVRYGPYMPIR
jgi:hypothetical protein